jgi:hypothetical protein
MTVQFTDRAPTTSRPGVLVVSVWFESRDPSGFRARLASSQPDGSVQTWGVAADPDTVIRLTRSWLSSLTSP